MLVKSGSISKPDITSLESKPWSSSANVKESLIVYSLVVRGSSIGTKNFASLYVSVPLPDKIGLRDGRPSVKILWTLAEFQVLNLKGLNSYIAQFRLLFCLPKFLRTSITLFPIWIMWFKIFHGLYKLFETLTCHLECFSFYKHNLFCSEWQLCYLYPLFVL